LEKGIGPHIEISKYVRNVLSRKIVIWGLMYCATGVLVGRSREEY
jgi:hypothetical protein